MEWTDEWHQSENQNPTRVLDPCVYPLLPSFIISDKSGMVNLNALVKIITQSTLYRVFRPGQPLTVSLGQKCYPFLKKKRKEVVPLGAPKDNYFTLDNRMDDIPQVN